MGPRRAGNPVCTWRRRSARSPPPDNCTRVQTATNVADAREAVPHATWVPLDKGACVFRRRDRHSCIRAAHAHPCAHLTGGAPPGAMRHEGHPKPAGSRAASLRRTRRAPHAEAEASALRLCADGRTLRLRAGAGPTRCVACGHQPRRGIAHGRLLQSSAGWRATCANAAGGAPFAAGRAPRYSPPPAARPRATSLTRTHRAGCMRRGRDALRQGTADWCGAGACSAHHQVRCAQAEGDGSPARAARLP